MDDRGPASSQALPRKRTGHQREGADEEEAMHRRRRGLRRDDPTADDPTSDDDNYDRSLKRQSSEALQSRDTDEELLQVQGLRVEAEGAAALPVALPPPPQGQHLLLEPQPEPEPQPLEAAPGPQPARQQPQPVVLDAIKHRLRSAMIRRRGLDAFADGNLRRERGCRGGYPRGDPPADPPAEFPAALPADGDDGVDEEEELEEAAMRHNADAEMGLVLMREAETVEELRRLREWMRDLHPHRYLRLARKEATGGGAAGLRHLDGATYYRAPPAAELPPPSPPSPPPPDMCHLLACEPAAAPLSDAVPSCPVAAVLENGDLVKAVLMELSVVERCRAAGVSRLWRGVVNDRAFWRRVNLLGRHISQEQVLQLCRRQRGVIEELRLGGSRLGGNDTGLLSRLVHSLSGLTTLELQHWLLTDRSLAHLSGGLPALRELQLRDVTIVGGSMGGQADASLTHPGLTCLELTNCKSGRLQLACPQLARLTLAACQLPSLLASESSLPRLTHLNLASTHRLTDAGLISLITSLSALTHLALTDLPVSEELLRGAARSLEHLASLELHDCGGLGLSPVRGAPVFGALRRLVVRRCEALTTSAALLLVEGCVGVEELALEGCGGLGGLTTSLPVLRSLSLRGCKKLKYLELRCRRLEELHLGAWESGGPCGAMLRRVVLASDSLRSLSWHHLPILDDLELDCPFLTSLSLTDCDNLKDNVFDLLTDVQEVTLASPPAAPVEHPLEATQPWMSTRREILPPVALPRVQALAPRGVPIMAAGAAQLPAPAAWREVTELSAAAAARAAEAPGGCQPPPGEPAAEMEVQREADMAGGEADMAGGEAAAAVAPPPPAAGEMAAFLMPPPPWAGPPPEAALPPPLPRLHHDEPELASLAQAQAQAASWAAPHVVSHPKIGGCPRLQELRLEGCERLRHARLRHSRLTAMSLRGCRGLESLALSCPALGALRLEECGELAVVALTAAGLSSLSLGGCSALREAELTCRSLKQLSLKGCGSLRSVVLDCPQLGEVDATFCGELTDEALAVALSRCPPLTSLSLSVCCGLGPEVPAALTGLAGLRHLDLSYSCVSRLAPVLSTFTGLTALCLSSCRELEGEGEELLQLLPDRGRALPHLVSLDVSYCPLSPRVVVPLVSGLTQLTHLALSGCSGADEGIWRNAARPPRQRPSLPPASGAAAGRAAQPMLTRETAPERAAATSQVDADAAASRLEKLSLVRCNGLVSLCLGLVPEQDEGEEERRKGSSGGSVAARSGGGGGGGWRWSAGGPPPRSLLGPPWRPVGCVLSGLRSLRLGLSGVQVVALSLSHLTHLDLNGCSALCRLELRCPALTELHLQACCRLPADLWLPLLSALGGSGAGGGAGGLVLLDAQHAGQFGEAVAATLAAAAVMAVAAEGDVDPGPGCSQPGAGGGGGAAGGAAAAARPESGLGMSESEGGEAAVGAVVGSGGAGGCGSGQGRLSVDAATLLAARDQPWWLLPRGATVLACGPNCSTCGRRNRRALLGL